ncbi:aspartate-semialdehyde dehydrogenase [bacterium]|nr:aspartate-semialdehyde dehydrogenase [bacterium]
MNLALVGATGMVGRTMLQVLEERNIQVDEFYPVSSARSKGQSVFLFGKEYKCITLEELMDKEIDYALFSAGGAVSLEWAPRFEALGAVVIDNSSAWRMNEDVALVVPQINAEGALGKRKIIANPNCSTIQMVMALAPLHKRFGIKRLVISTYQSVTGTGKAAVEQMESERKTGSSSAAVYPHPIDLNCIPHCDIFLENGYTKEEMKLVYETRKILGDQNIAITATAVRVPVVGGHSESVNIEFEKDPSIEEIKEILNSTEGVVVQDDVNSNTYPMPRTALNRDEVFVGRIRKDESAKNAVNMWIVADNLRKGAATNAVEILEYLTKKN